MKFSVVTISYNQARFLERAIQSIVCQQDVDLEYILVDPGSTDGSHDIIEAYKSQVAHIIFENDQGPADGLNRGFSRATGDIYCYLNSDDEFEPGVFQQIAAYFGNHADVDVVCGHAWIVNENGRRLRRVWSDPFERLSQAYGGSIQIQPSTFIRAQAFHRTQGFNPENKSNWDGELLVDLALSGARIAIINEYLSKYRVYRSSITGSGAFDKQIKAFACDQFRKLIGRDWRSYDRVIAMFWFIARQFRNPTAFLERIKYGPVYRRR